MGKEAAFYLYNTLSRKIELFKPLKEGEVGIYCCGPTVYNYQHIGNLRTYIFEDILVRALRYAGYNVKHVMNITDVGHLVSDADQGEDKMVLASRREGKTSAEIADFYSKIFFEHCRWLNINRPDIVCCASEHIQQMIELIKQLEEKKIAYQAGGNVYFDVSKFASYGDLARLDLDNLRAGARIVVDEQKRGPLDFALWFTKSKFENQELQWDSPWGRGYPGWHIECSAMAAHYLGESLDIHCGGIDHIPVHHTNEIAQSEAASGKKFAQFWVHGGFLVLGKEKMAKSKGEFLTLDLLKEKGYDPMSYRLFCCSGSYRNELSWSWQALEAAANSLRNIKNLVLALKQEVGSEIGSKELLEMTLSDIGTELKESFRKEIFNDLNLPNALAVFHRTLAEKNIPPPEKLALLYDFDRVLGLEMKSWEQEQLTIPPEALALLIQREEARKARDFKTADALRAKLSELGFAVEDRADGPTLKRI